MGVNTTPAERDITILSGQTLAPVVGLDKVGKSITGFRIPADLDGATTLSFFLSSGDITSDAHQRPLPDPPSATEDWGDFYDSAGAQVTITVTGREGDYMMLTPEHEALFMRAPRFVRLAVDNAAPAAGLKFGVLMDVL